MTTATKSKPKNTAAEIDWMATFTEAMNAPGALGNTYNRFYNYSLLNQIRLMMQGLLEPVATYNRWTELGRQVRKGSHAKSVLAPVLVTKIVTDDNGKAKIVDGKPVKRQVLIGFRDSRTVFGFSDTDGDELPEIEIPAWSSERALAALDVSRVAFAEIDGNRQGYSYEDDKGRHVAINPVAVYPVKTMLHELAHLVLGHCKAKEGEIHRGIAEFEAEATAYLVAKEIELAAWDPAESRKYIDGWLTHEGHRDDDRTEVTDKSIGRIFSAANKILVAGR